jgi:hypothetical protein
VENNGVNSDRSVLFFFVVYITVLSVSALYVARNGLLDGELERIRKEAVMACLRYCPGILLEGLRKNKEKLQSGRPAAWLRFIISTF